jgi:hypothetical protein
MENQFICINDVFTAQQKKLFRNLPIKGELYTLKEEVVSSIDGKKGYVFYELENDCHPNGQEYSFRPSRFVPLEKSKSLELELINKTYGKA